MAFYYMHLCLMQETASSLIWSQDYILENATTPYMNLKVVFCPKIMANRGLIRRETHLWMMEAKAVPACYRKGCFCDVRKWLWKGQCQNGVFGVWL